MFPAELFYFVNRYTAITSGAGGLTFGWDKKKPKRNRRKKVLCNLTITASCFQIIIRTLAWCKSQLDVWQKWLQETSVEKCKGFKSKVRLKVSLEGYLEWKAAFFLVGMVNMTGVPTWMKSLFWGKRRQIRFQQIISISQAFGQCLGCAMGFCVRVLSLMKTRVETWKVHFV